MNKLIISFIYLFLNNVLGIILDLVVVQVFLAQDKEKSAFVVQHLK